MEVRLMTVQVTFNDNGVSYDRNAFFQYDYGRKLEIHGLNLPDGTQFHFANKGAGAVTKISSTVDEVTTVDVPQSVLLLPGEMNVYIYSTSETSGITIKSITFHVKGREKPGDYAPPDEPNIIEELQAKLEQIIQDGIAEYTPDPQDVKDIIDEYVPENFITDNDLAEIPGTAWDAVRGKAIRDDFNALNNKVGVANGIATLGEDGKVPGDQLPDMPAVSGDTKDSTVTFTEAEEDADIASGDTHGTLFGKILKRLNIIKSSGGSGPGDTKDSTVTFIEAEMDADIASGETHATLFGKLLKSVKTFRSGKFDISNIIHTAAVNDSTKVPSSVVTKALADQITTLNDNLTEQSGTITSATGITVYSYTLRKCAKYIELSFVAWKTDQTVFTASRTVLFTLPTGFMVSSGNSYVCTASTGVFDAYNKHGIIYFDPNGTVNFDAITTDCKKVALSVVYYIG
jgi:hypothetical protein